MSSTRSRAFASKIKEDEINDLILKLQALLPQLNRRHNTTVSTSKILEETCNYIKRLHREVDDLSERLTQLLDTVDTTDVDVETLKRLQQ